MRNRLILVFIIVGFLANVSTAVINIDTQNETGAITQYAKQILIDKLDVLANGQNQCDLSVHLQIVPELKGIGAEGYRIQTQKGNVLISAISERGILYGAVAFTEWVIRNSNSYMVDGNQADIDFTLEQGQAKNLLNNLPNYNSDEQPFYALRGIDMQLALGVADLIDTNKVEKKYADFCGQEGGFHENIKEWKKWCDWLARHRMNYIGNWPYSCGTNWWELAYDPNTAGMSIFSKEEIERAAQIREELLKYAKDRGLTPYLMNYVLGAPNPTIVKNFPGYIGPKARPDWPAAFCMSNPELKGKFKSQIRAIVKTYPSLGGLHLRWWGESFPCSCPKCRGKCGDLLREYTLAIVNAALETRPDLEIRITGWLRNGGTKEFAAKLPKNVIIQTKWGIDWEPTPFPNVPYCRISELDQRFMISQCLPGEEFHPVGGVQYKSLQAGMRQYSRDKSKFPNLTGFAFVAGEKDHDWITSMNFAAAARLDWDPIGTDVDAIVKNYIASQLRLKSENADIARKAWQALAISQDVWESYCCDFGGVTKYVDCLRFHDLFGLKRAQELKGETLRKELPQMFQYSQSIERAMELMNTAGTLYEKSGKPGNQAFFDDIMLQTEVYNIFFKSRVKMVQAFISIDNKDADLARTQFEEMKSLDKELVHAVLKKPNISDDFEFEGMSTPIHIPPRVNAEIKAIDSLLASFKTQ